MEIHAVLSGSDVVLFNWEPRYNFVKLKLRPKKFKANLDTTDNRGLLEMSSRDETVFDG